MIYFFQAGRESLLRRVDESLLKFQNEISAAIGFAQFNNKKNVEEWRELWNEELSYLKMRRKEFNSDSEGDKIKRFLDLVEESRLLLKYEIKEMK